MPETNKWTSCYDEGWQGIIVPEAFSHPAKMAYGLLKRILAHAKPWLKEGDVIVDPFGGIGSTGILGAYEGYQVVCVELEQKFVDLAKENFDMHEHALEIFGFPFPIIIQGDSRQLCQIVEKADCIVSSPPFQKSMVESGDPNYAHKFHGNQKDYGNSAGQLGSMKPGKVDMVVSSPPYAESLSSEKDGIDESKLAYGKPRASKAYKQGLNYGQTPSNLGNLKSGDVDCLISSPPYEGVLGNRKHEGNQKKYYERQKRYNEAHPEHKRPSAESMCYPCSDGNIASEQGDTFWSAAKIIIEQCFQILKPSGHAIWVVKSFVRNKKIVDFPGDWRRLCEAVGFKTVCIHHAMLVKETKHQTLFGDTEIKRKEKKSFFRRLAESKGSPRIDYEVVLCMSR